MNRQIQHLHHLKTQINKIPFKNIHPHNKSGPYVYCILIINRNAIEKLTPLL